MRGDNHGPADHHQGLYGGQHQHQDEKVEGGHPAGRTADADEIHRYTHIAGQQRRDEGGQQLAQVELPIAQRAAQQRLDAAALGFAGEALQRHHQRDGDGKEADDHQQEGDEAVGDHVGAILAHKTDHLAGGEIHQGRKEQGQHDDREDDPPVTQLVAHFAVGDDESGA